MADSKTFGLHCGVLEGQFPCMGKCFNKRESIFGVEYYNECIHCSIWTSLPDAANLEVTYIFECSKFGYDIRIKEE